MSDRDTQPIIAIAVSCPGGMARQFRVQTASIDAPDAWKLAGSFRDPLAARACARELADSGHHTRIIACTSLPTAA